MAKPRNNLLDYLTYVGVRLFAMFVHMFSWEANLVTAKLMGDLVFCFSRHHRRIAIEQLRLSFPDWPESKVQKVARDSFRGMCTFGLEFMFTTRRITPSSWCSHTILTNQHENVRLLTERKGGVVYVLGHFGNWERVGYTLAILGFDGFAVARPLDNPYLNHYVMDVREERGMTVLSKKGATFRMDDIFDSHRYVSFIVDQGAGSRGLFVDFFGRKASTSKAPALMAMRFEIPVVVAYGRRRDEHYNFEIGIERIIYPQDWADKDDPLRWITQEYTSAIEDVVRRDPEQYLWLHRRWKHVPRGQQRPKDGIG